MRAWRIRVRCIGQRPAELADTDGDQRRGSAGDALAARSSRTPTVTTTWASPTAWSNAGLRDLDRRIATTATPTSSAVDPDDATTTACATALRVRQRGRLASTRRTHASAASRMKATAPRPNSDDRQRRPLRRAPRIALRHRTRRFVVTHDSDICDDCSVGTDGFEERCGRTAARRTPGSTPTATAPAI